MSDSETSISKADCEALITSEQDLYVEYVKSSSPKGKVASSNIESSDVTQEAINVKILLQIEKLGRRYNSIKNSMGKQSVVKRKCKKAKRKVDSLATVSPSGQAHSDLNVLRQDTSVQALVEQRLRQLADAEKSSTKVKSLHGGSVEVLVPNRMKWPHEYVLSGLSKEPVSYYQVYSGWLAFVAS